MTRLTLHGSLCLILLFYQCHAITYWLDSSCSGPLAGVMAEVQSMASRGKAQLADNSNEVMAAAFKTIFKVDKSDAATVQTVSNGFGIIAGMTSATTREASDVRIYCDNDDAGAISTGKRWQPEPDLPNAGKKSKNSKKQFADQMWWDHVNKIYRRPGSKGVQDEDVETWGQTYKFSAKDVDGENPDRESITIANLALQVDHRLLGTINQKSDLTQVDMETLEDLISVTLFHELTHLTKVLALPTDPDVTDWENIIQLSAAEAIKTPDSFAFLGLSAILNDRNIRLSSVEADAEEGKFEFIKPPTADSSGGGGSKKSKRLVGVDGPRYPKVNAAALKYGKRGLTSADARDSLRLMGPLKVNHFHA